MVTEDHKGLNGSRNTSHFEDESWEKKPWKKFEKVVFRLQQRIYKASQEGNRRKVKKLQRLLLTEFSKINVHLALDQLNF
jgi:RNA-directed DNA polymerase